MKSVVAVDLDNVIAKTDPKIREIIESISEISLSQDDIRSWDYAEALVSKGLDIFSAQQVISQTFNRFHKEECLDVESVQGAIEGILCLREAGLDILIVTGRPETPRCRELTKQWLARFEIPGFWLRMEENKAQVSARWSFLIDDAPHQAETVAGQGTSVLLFDYPWNRNVQLHPLIKRIRNWGEIIGCILNHQGG